MEDLYKPFMYNNIIFGTDIGKRESIHKLYSSISICNLCPGLNSMSNKDEHTICVHPRGNVDSKIMIIGQSNAFPQSQWDAEKGYHPNVPFLYGCGALLNKCLIESKLTREDVWITNVVKAHPPGNRPSTKQEIKNCIHFLKDEINIIKPSIIITLGKDAFNVIIALYARDEYDNMQYCSDNLGKHYPDIMVDNFIFAPMYHPAYIMKLSVTREIDYIQSFKNIIESFNLIKFQE